MNVLRADQRKRRTRWGAVATLLQAAAFVEADAMNLIRIGLNMIPLSSHVGRSIREAVWCWQNKLTWGDARERIASRFGHIQPCNGSISASMCVVVGV